MTPHSALLALIEQLLAAGLTENPSLDEPGRSGIVDRGFTIREGKSKARGGRRAPTAQGNTHEERFAVALTHILQPHLGQRATLQAREDRLAVLRQLRKNGTSLTTAGQVFIGECTPKYLNGGAVLRQTRPVRVCCTIDLS